MKKLILLVTLLAILFLIMLETTPEKKSIQLVSPLLKNDKVLGINQWFPSGILGAQTNIPNITAQAALFIDSKSGKSLYSKNPNKRLPVASLVKIATALIALEYKSLDATFVVSQKAAEAEPDKMLLIAGERLTLKELLYGVFLISANDAAEVLAEGTTGDRNEFIKLMNDRAKQLGMEGSFFTNPTGFDEDSQNSYSTAYDLVILTRYLIRRFPQVIEISQASHIYLPITETHQDYDMYTGINLITTYQGVVGFKTGYTSKAGLTLITLARKDGHEVIGVLLGSDNRRDEARELLDYSFKKLGI